MFKEKATLKKTIMTIWALAAAGGKRLENLIGYVLATVVSEAACGRGMTMSDEGKNNLFYVCSLIEYVGRRTKNRRGDVVAAMDDVCLKHHLMP